eukprot:TRINITY_DN1096_c0_g1_i1.p1 TRINITY_DN1096_c0_g1~~TRINITY_DN1096_c0_g1_i1.p1  ORF type:complete len:166 (-),score=1.42 TRINITY_DN1096_c0_g1_i1:83-580(-)
MSDLYKTFYEQVYNNWAKQTIHKQQISAYQKEEKCPGCNIRGTCIFLYRMILRVLIHLYHIVSKTDNFCSRCGKNLRKIESTETIQEMQIDNPPSRRENRKRKRRSRVLWTKSEIKVFNEAITRFGPKDYDNIAKSVQTRNKDQVKTRVNKYLLRLRRSGTPAPV